MFEFPLKQCKHGVALSTVIGHAGIDIFCDGLFHLAKILKFSHSHLAKIVISTHELSHG